ncbi:secreted mucin like glycoprotein [Cryptosporidium canis]|uniref:Secreted mucin like glycoprotein n=1 Tax=Cryptosporidium canis TaxID=195482 RepID=A0A9D5DJL7_9CRYT|nr:secreted mucin like glycoprotein [Cryptosporidium canis]
MLLRSIGILPLAVLCLTLVWDLAHAMENEELGAGLSGSSSLEGVNTTSSETSFSLMFQSSTSTSTPNSIECPDSMFPELSPCRQEATLGGPDSPVIVDELYASYYSIKEPQESSRDGESSPENIVLVTPPVTTPVPSPESTTTTTTTTTTASPVSDVSLQYPVFGVDNKEQPDSPVDEALVSWSQTEGSREFGECLDHDCLDLASVKPKVSEIVRLFEQRPATDLKLRSTSAHVGSDVSRLVDRFEHLEAADQSESRELSPTLAALRDGTLEYLELPERSKTEAEPFIPTREKVPRIVSSLESARLAEPMEMEDDFVAYSVVSVEDKETEKRLEPVVTREAVRRVVGAWEKHRDQEQIPLNGRRTGYTFRDLCNERYKRCSETSQERAPLISDVSFPPAEHKEVDTERILRRKVKIRAVSSTEEAARKKLQEAASKVGAKLEDDQVMVSRLRGYKLVQE